MLNQTILLKVRQRLNKLDSQDYDNIEDWKIVEAFNKGQVDWCRRNLHGLNIVKEGDEQSTRRIDDLQVLLVNLVLNVDNRQTYYEGSLPLDYLQWKRISCKAADKCCPDPRPMVIYLAEVANVDELLRDKNKKPSFEWAETFATMQGDKLQIYTNGQFEVVKPTLTYYRQPTRIEIAGVQDPYTLTTPAVDVISEFKDDLVELFVDECSKIIAGDIESINQMQREQQATESNN
jgi:hypothetical protein